MKLFNTVAIVGTGLIGGSIGLDLKAKKLAARVIGVSRHRRTIALARQSGAIDSGSQDIRAVKGADLVILATPVETIMELAPRISRLIGPDCIVTDVGSTKAEIVARLEKVFVRFVGSHPLAGSERRGIQHASAGLLRNSLCLVTPTKHTDPQALAKVKRLWLKLGAKVITMTPRMHDEALAFVSHLPHAAAYSLINTVPPEYLRFCAGGLKDTTRIASSDPAIWVDIFLSNRVNILRAIDRLQGKLSGMRSALSRKKRSALVSILHSGQKKRASLK
ncbi:MAG TPA: prephenate dehydrogenase [Patescibacteria group bacterium]|nr:prephenate dehydrogenase [Patescibacteria group bacterium]